MPNGITALHVIRYKIRLLGNKLQLLTENKLLLYTAIFKPI